MGASSRSEVVCRALAGAFLGLLFGGLGGGFVAVGLACVAEAADERLAGLHSIATLVFLAVAVFSGGASALAGGLVVLWRSRGVAVGLTCGLIVAFCPCLALWAFNEDGTWPLSMLFFGGGILAGATIGGALVAWTMSDLGA